MESFKYQIVLLLGSLLSTGVNGQSFTKSERSTTPVGNTAFVEVTSSYTNLELEEIEGEEVVVEAVLQTDGLSQYEAEDYFQKWKVEVNNKNDKVVITSLLNDETSTDWKRHGYYEGYFLNDAQLAAISNDIEGFEKTRPRDEQEKSKQSNHGATFDSEAYIKEGDAYLQRWQKENNEKIGKRWFNKTREERIVMLKDPKPAKPQKEEKSGIGNKMKQEARLKKDLLPSANVRPLKKRAVIQKVLKIGVPKGLKISVAMKHGKVELHGEISNLNAELKYALLEAETISGNNTRIKGRFANFEIDSWQSGDLNVTFSDFVLIKQVDELSLTSNSSIVSIDAVTKKVDVRGNFKMLSMDMAPSVTSATIDVVDSKRVWLKLPDASYNLYYKGVDSRLIHPDKFSLKTGKNASEQVLESTPLKNNERTIDIKSLASVMQIYDVPWEDLKIKSLEGL